MSARIFQPSRPATQSGNAKSQGWVLEFNPEMSSKIDPLMGWTSSGEMQAQVKLSFPDKKTDIFICRDALHIISNGRLKIQTFKFCKKKQKINV